MILELCLIFVMIGFIVSIYLATLALKRSKSQPLGDRVFKTVLAAPTYVQEVGGPVFLAGPTAVADSTQTAGIVQGTIAAGSPRYQVRIGLTPGLKTPISVQVTVMAAPLFLLGPCAVVDFTDSYIIVRQDFDAGTLNQDYVGPIFSYLIL